MKNKKWRIECGEHNGVVEAPTIGVAWRKLIKGKKTGFGEVVRFREMRFPSGPWLYWLPAKLDFAK